MKLNPSQTKEVAAKMEELRGAITDYFKFKLEDLELDQWKQYQFIDAPNMLGRVNDLRELANQLEEYRELERINKYK